MGRRSISRLSRWLSYCRDTYPTYPQRLTSSIYSSHPPTLSLIWTYLTQPPIQFIPPHIIETLCHWQNASHQPINLAYLFSYCTRTLFHRVSSSLYQSKNALMERISWIRWYIKCEALLGGFLCYLKRLTSCWGIMWRVGAFAWTLCWTRTNLMRYGWNTIVSHLSKALIHTTCRLMECSLTFSIFSFS